MAHARKHSSTNVYHVTSRGTGEMIIFEDDEDRRHYLQLLLNAKRKFGLLIYSYCLMSNHVHIIFAGSLEDISCAMKYLNGQYASDFNKRHHRTGHLFQRRFDSVPIEDEAHFLAAIRYVICNPVRSGICKAQDYKWSSYREYAGEQFLTDTWLFAEELCNAKKLKKFLAGYSEMDRSFKTGRQRMSDEAAITMAKDILGIKDLHQLQTLDEQERNSSIVRLRQAGIGVRQIARLTGLGKSTVSNVCAPSSLCPSGDTESVRFPI